LLDARRELDTITAAAIVEELEADDEVHDFFGIRRVKKKVEDKEMCKPLVRYRSSHFFTIIRNRGPYFNTSFESTVLESDSSTWEFPKGSPDFGMFECLSSTAIASGSKRALWRQTGGFCEVRPTLQQGPKSKDPKVVKPVVC
jgi:hypothetical protein